MKNQKTAICKLLFVATFIMGYIGNANTQDNATIKIGTQIWMAKNLDVSTYRNGDPIPQVQDSTEWAKLKTGAWCYYKNNPEYGATFGKLYNWFAVNDPRGLAPTGYHIPDDAEWATLRDYLGVENAAIKLKSTSHWIEGNGTNTSGFSGVPGGSRVGYGTDARMGGWGRWWSSTENSNNSATLFLLDYFKSSVSIYNYDKRCGFSVRCLKD